MPAAAAPLGVILIADLRDATINNFKINGSAGGATGVDCVDGSLCRLSGNKIQAASDAAGVAVFAPSQLRLDGGTPQRNGTGLFVDDGASGVAANLTIQKNPAAGIDVRLHSFAYTIAAINNNGAGRVLLGHNSTLACLECQISANWDAGVVVRRNFDRKTLWRVADHR